MFCIRVKEIKIEHKTCRFKEIYYEQKKKTLLCTDKEDTT